MTLNVRQELERLMRATLADRQHWVYWFHRPIDVPPSWRPGQRVAADCSKGVQFLCRWAGAPDPMGNGWANWGNSTTLAVHLEHLLTPTVMRPGDIVTFGHNAEDHAAMVLEPGVDPLLWSHGHQGAPNTYRLSEDRRERQLLRLPVLVESPPLPGELRARKGYWNWLAWSIGEQDWKPYGRSNRRVRPDVPRVIPRSWWRQRLAFLAARKKPNPPTTDRSLQGYMK